MERKAGEKEGEGGRREEREKRERGAEGVGGEEGGGEKNEHQGGSQGGRLGERNRGVGDNNESIKANEAQTSAQRRC